VKKPKANGDEIDSAFTATSFTPSVQHTPPVLPTRTTWSVEILLHLAAN